MSNVRANVGGAGLTSSVLTSGRASSVNSHGSVGPKNRASVGHLQNSEAKSMVRQAIKNQKRIEKVGGNNSNYNMAGYQSSTSQDKNYSEKQQ